jgi:hypothetical protein
MNLLHSEILRVTSLALGLAFLTSSSATAADVAAISARELADRLSGLQSGTSYARLRLEVKQPDGTTKTVLQLQIKERCTKTATDVLYQVLWPKERKGEGVLLHKAGGSPPAGSLFTPPGTVSSLNASQMNEALFGSDLSYQDVTENFFGWENQAIVGNEVLDRVSCLILESRPGKGELSTYASVRSWIDPRRLVPLRIEKYLPTGRLARRIETTRVGTDDKGHSIPADLTVRGPREDSVTELDGSRIKHDVAYTDRDFSSEGLGQISAPSSGPE